MIENRWYPFTSRYDPEAEAKKQVSSIEPSELFIVWGSAGLYHAIALVNKYPGRPILVLEPWSEALRLTQEEILPTIDVPAVHSICLVHYQGEKTTLPPWFQMSLYPGAQVIIHPVYARLFPDLTRHFEMFIKHYLDQSFNDYRIQSVFGKRWLYCFTRNMKSAISNPAVVLSIADHPVILGAGPLLARKKPDSGRQVICSDTSLAFAREQLGETDCIVCSIDSQQHSLRHLYGIRTMPDKAILDPCSHPHYHRNIRSIEFLRSPYPLWQFFLQLSGILAEPISSGGNVGQTMVSWVIQNTQVRSFYTGGLDFRYTKQRPYTNPSFIYTEFHSRSNRVNPAENQNVLLWISQDTYNDGMAIQTPLLAQYQKNFIELVGSHCYGNKEDSWDLYTKRANHPGLNPTPQLPAMDIPSLVSALIKRLRNFESTLLNEDLPLFPDGNWLESFILIASVLASIQRSRVQCGLNPADTMKDDILSACSYTIRSCEYILEGDDPC